MILINSAQYVISDLQAEFGKIPPTFLPFGSKRLFELQVEELSKTFPGEDIYLSLPSDFTIPHCDLKLIQELGLFILKHPVHLSLGESVLKSLREIESSLEVIRILHGDTLILDLPRFEDCISVSVPSSEQNWFYDNNGDNAVWTGYFSISGRNQFIARLEEDLNFEQSIKGYGEKVVCPRVMSMSWLDFGHVSTYYRARVNRLVKRDFNEIYFDSGYLKKTGSKKKIQAEIHWYQNVPWEIKIMLPQFFQELESSESNSYLMEYLPIPSLAEIFVFGNSSRQFWLNIFELLDSYFTFCSSLTLEEFPFQDSQLVQARFESNVRDHISNRMVLLEHSSSWFNRIKPISVNGSAPCSVDFLVTECLSHIANSPPTFGVQHGDLCLSNILFEVRTNRIRLIDPRGMDFTGENTIYGDLRYDFAKLAHSFLGFYDFIIAGRYEFFDHSSSEDLVYSLNFLVDDSKLARAEDFFLTFLKDKCIEKPTLAYMVILFITMLPLHEENSIRQRVLLANSVLLFNKYLRSDS